MKEISVHDAENHGVCISKINKIRRGINLISLLILYTTNYNAETMGSIHIFTFTFTLVQAMGKLQQVWKMYQQK